MKYNTFFQNIKSKMQDSTKKIPFEAVTRRALQSRKTKKRPGDSTTPSAGTGLFPMKTQKQYFLQSCDLQNRFPGGPGSGSGRFPG